MCAQNLLTILSGTREEQPLHAATPGRLLRRMVACLIICRLCVLVAPQQFFVSSLEHANVLGQLEQRNVGVCPFDLFFNFG